MSEIRLEWNGGGMAVISAVWTLVNSAKESQVPMMFSFAGKIKMCSFLRNITQEKVTVWSLHESLEFLSLKLETTHLYWPKARKKKRVGEHLTGSNSH